MQSLIINSLPRTHHCALVLSEFAGAARELRQAYLINPHDINGLKETMVEAMNE